jgi:hypothetical protein
MLARLDSRLQDPMGLTRVDKPRSIIELPLRWAPDVMWWDSPNSNSHRSASHPRCRRIAPGPSGVTFIRMSGDVHGRSRRGRDGGLAGIKYLPVPPSFARQQPPRRPYGQCADVTCPPTLGRSGRESAVDSGPASGRLPRMPTVTPDPLHSAATAKRTLSSWSTFGPIPRDCRPLLESAVEKLIQRRR